MSIYHMIAEPVTSLIADYRARASKVPSIEATWGLVTEFVGDVVVVCEGTGADGKSKKAAAVEAVRRFYDVEIAPRDLPGVPNWIEPAFDRAIGFTISAIIGGMIDGFVAQFRDRAILPPPTLEIEEPTEEEPQP